MSCLVKNPKILYPQNNSDIRDSHVGEDIGTAGFGQVWKKISPPGFLPSSFSSPYYYFSSFLWKTKEKENEVCEIQGLF